MVGRAARDLLSRWRKSFGIFAGTGLLFIVSFAVEPHSLGKSALAAMWPFAAVLILASIGQTLVVQQRGIDLSVPGFISLTVVLVTHVPNGHSSRLPEAILLAFGVAIGAGILNGLMVAKIGIPAIVQTLGMNAVLYGIDVGISNGTPTETTSALQNFTSYSVAGIPVPLVVALVAALVIELLVKRTAAGRRFEACGVSYAAGRAAGLRCDRYQIAAYFGAAVLYCTAGLMLAGIISQPDAFSGDNYLLPSVAAVVLGGTSLAGGVGSVVASAGGAIFLSQLQQFVLTTGASAAVQNLVEAGALAVGIAIYGLRFRPGFFKSFVRTRANRQPTATAERLAQPVEGEPVGATLHVVNGASESE